MTTAPDGAATQLKREPVRTVTKVVDPFGHEQTFEYDARGNQTAQVDALGRTVRTQYDASGNETAVTDASGATATTTYDGSGNLTSMAAAGLGTTQLQYDDEGRLKAMVDAAGGATRYSYDALGRRVGVTDQLGRTTVTDYDVLGRKSLTTDRNGTATTFDYDAMSRLTEKVVGSDATAYEYDGAGRVTASENADARVTIGYDAGDKPLRMATTLAGSSVARAVDYTYDSAGRRATMTDGGVTDTYGYDAAGRLETLASSQVGTFRFGYDVAGRRSSLQRPNGVTTTYSYDDANAVTAIVHAKGSQVLDESRYTYDSAGRRTVVKQFDGDHRFGYDDAGRVTSADHPSGQTDEAFAYDLLGNRTGGGEQYDAANKLTSRNGFSYTYDDEGRTASRTETSTGKVTRFGWGQGGQLRTVTLPSGDVTRYRYDPLGRRVESAAPGRTRVQVYGVDPNAVAESSGGVETRFTFGVGYDSPLAMQRGGVASFFAQDALSSVTSLANSSGAVSGRYSYDTYGQIKASSGTTASPYTYTGREWDSDAGIYDYRARQYDPATGRFLSEDPVPTANLYPYVDGRPTAAVDPTGKQTSAEQAEVMAWGNQISAWHLGAFNGFFSAVAQGQRCGWDAEKVRMAAVTGFISGFFAGKAANAAFRGMGLPADRFEAVIGLFLANFVTGSLSIIVSELYAGGVDAIDPMAVIVGGVGAGVAGVGAGLSPVLGGVALSAGAAGFATLAVELGQMVGTPGDPSRC